MMINLPYPTKEELKPFNKSKYIDRITSLELTVKYNMPFEKICDMAIQNFDSIFLYDKELTFKK